MAVVKITIALGTLAVGGTGTYLTYDYLTKTKKSKKEEPSVKENPPNPIQEEGIPSKDASDHSEA